MTLQAISLKTRSILAEISGEDSPVKEDDMLSGVLWTTAFELEFIQLMKSKYSIVITREEIHKCIVVMQLVELIYLKYKEAKLRLGELIEKG